MNNQEDPGIRPATANSTPEKKVGMARITAAARYSAAGLLSALRSEEAFRQESIAFCVLAPLGWWLGETPVEQVLLIGSLVLVLIVELLNTAVENVVDRVGHEYHELSKDAKDTGSAAVFVSIGLVFLTWGLILLTPAG
ncbi:MAG: hypothetical protein RLZZ385_1566 [Pseudomonadota bacterium]|jgi:diacylglycerol kinase (ATP)